MVFNCLPTRDFIRLRRLQPSQDNRYNICLPICVSPLVIVSISRPFHTIYMSFFTNFLTPQNNIWNPVWDISKPIYRTEFFLNMIFLGSIYLQEITLENAYKTSLSIFLGHFGSHNGAKFLTLRWPLVEGPFWPCEWGQISVLFYGTVLAQN